MCGSSDNELSPLTVVRMRGLEPFLATLSSIVDIATRVHAWLQSSTVNDRDRASCLVAHAYRFVSGWALGRSSDLSNTGTESVY
jgi:hypothetical protein